jgi:hypothetical protein
MMTWKAVAGCCKQVMVMWECLIGRWNYHDIPTCRKPLNQNTESQHKRHESTVEIIYFFNLYLHIHSYIYLFFNKLIRNLGGSSVTTQTNNFKCKVPLSSNILYSWTVNFYILHLISQFWRWQNSAQSKFKILLRRWKDNFLLSGLCFSLSLARNIKRRMRWRYVRTELEIHVEWKEAVVC